MIASSNITVFPDPVGADTTRDSSRIHEGLSKCYSCKKVDKLNISM